MSGRIAAVLAVLLLSAALGGCSGPPWVEAASANAITLRWYPQQVSARAAQQVANAHCMASADKDATLAAMQEDDGAVIARYGCG